jgi:death on curing protein
LPGEPGWLPIEAVIEINRIAVTATGEHHFLRDPGLLDSALARPQNAFAYGEEDIVTLAVRLLAGVAQAHAFEQGNKRTSFISMIEFLMINGYELTIEDSLRWADAVIGLVEHQVTEEDFVRLLRPFIVPVGADAKLENKGLASDRLCR